MFIVLVISNQNRNDSALRLVKQQQQAVPGLGRDINILSQPPFRWSRLMEWEPAPGNNHKTKESIISCWGVDRPVRTECFTGWPSKQDHFSRQLLESMGPESKDGEAVADPGLSPLGSDGVWVASAALVGTSSCPFPKGVVARCFNPPERLAGW